MFRDLFPEVNPALPADILYYYARAHNRAGGNMDVTDSACVRTARKQVIKMEVKSSLLHRPYQRVAEMQQIVFVSTIILVSLSVRAGIPVIIFASGGAYGLVAVWFLRDLQ